MAALLDEDASVDGGTTDCALRFDFAFSASTAARLPRRVKGRLATPTGCECSAMSV